MAIGKINVWEGFFSATSIRSPVRIKEIEFVGNIDSVEWPGVKARRCEKIYTDGEIFHGNIINIKLNAAAWSAFELCRNSTPNPRSRSSALPLWHMASVCLPLQRRRAKSDWILFQIVNLILTNAEGSVGGVDMYCAALLQLIESIRVSCNGAELRLPFQFATRFQFKRRTG